MSEYDNLDDVQLSEEELAALREEIEDDQIVEEDDDSVTNDDPEQDANGEEDPPVEEQIQESEPDPEPEPELPQQKIISPPKDDQLIPSKLDTLNTKLTELKKQFDEGEVSIDEYIDQSRALDREIIKEEIREERAKEKAQDSWDASVNNFLSINKYIKGNDIIYDSFAYQVDKLLRLPEWNAKSDSDVLNEAKRRIDAAFGVKPAPEKTESVSDKAKETIKKELSDRSKAPKTLQNAPLADANYTENSKFAYLDRLASKDGAKYEEELGKLSDEDLRKYLRS